MARTRQPQGRILLSPRYAATMRFFYTAWQGELIYADLNQATNSATTLEVNTVGYVRNIGAESSSNRYVWPTSTRFDPPSTGWTFAVIAKRNQSAASSYSRLFHRLQDNSATTQEYSFLTTPTSDGGGKPYGYVAGTNVGYATGTGGLSTSAFELLVITYNGTNSTFWRNGVAVQTVATSNPSSGTKPLHLGATAAGEVNATSAFVEQAMLDGRCWSAVEIAQWSANHYFPFASPRRLWTQLGAASGGAGPIAFNAETGAVAVTGAAATLNRGLAPLDAQPTTYAVSGTAATLARGWNLDSQPGSVAVSGTAATLARGWNLDAQPGTYAVTGIAATLARGWNLDAQPGTFAETGIAATLDYAQPGAYTLDCQPGTYAVTGAAATLTYVPLTHYSIDAAPGTFTLTGIAGTLTYNQIDAYEITASPGSFAVTGADATLTYTLASIWTDISGSTTSWTDQAAASTIWTDL